MDLVPLNAVRAAAADGAAGTSGTAVAAPVADIVRAAADIAADAWAAALPDAAADTAAVAWMPRLILLLLLRMPRLILLLLRVMRGLLRSLVLRRPLIRRATFTVALPASAAIVAPTSPAPPAASGFEVSDQGMVAVGPVRASVKLLHANETTLQFG